ncbi:septin and tuftelin-interacting protein 11 [Dorcoceras hygrometricum]|uniref:Septin and tuftelin-interacting protein 11 n=1 Tax=Dorcoceras hygrometricum TaxID=472368 RepID=A0A2Z7CD07_9LAMI|nr:septin and tuftelin-interacting protein 11 [Dorcoceras hygrometricum]
MDEYQEMERFGTDNDCDDGQWIGGEFMGSADKNELELRMISSTVYLLLVIVILIMRSLVQRDIGNPNPLIIQSQSTLFQPALSCPIGKLIKIPRKTRKQMTKMIPDLWVWVLDLVPPLPKIATMSLDMLKLKGEEDDFLPTGFGKKIWEGAKLRREREKEKAVLVKKSSQAVRRESDPSDVGSFEKHTKGIGMKLLEKMGYKGGGLGKNEQGILAPIQAKLRPKNMGMGFNDYNEASRPAMPQSDEKPLAQLSQPPEGRPKEKLWTKRAPQKKEVYITAEELLARKQAQGLEVFQKVFDMRGPQVRVLTNLENINEEEKARENDVPIPELQHNIRLIVDLAELDVQKLDRDLRNERETVVALQKEKEKLQKEAYGLRKQLDNMEEIVNVLDRISDQSSAGLLTLQSLATSFMDLQTRFSDDYTLCNLSCIACLYALPLFIRRFQG